MSLSPIINFLTGGKNIEGKTLEDYLSFTEEEMEGCHNHIQWMFPLKSPSSFNPNAPLLTDEDIGDFYNNEYLKNQIRRSFYKWLWFCGLQYDGNEILIVNYKRVYEIFGKFNHNYLRVTRVLLCLYTLGLRNECDLFYDALNHPIISKLANLESKVFWYEAYHGREKK
jgi:hypothetical protein